MEFKITFGATATERKWAEADAHTWDSIKENFVHHLPRDQKDGLCFVPGAIMEHPSDGRRRKKSAISEVSCLVYDIDGVGGSYDEIKAKIKASGVNALLWTTYNHKSDKTLIKTEEYSNWADPKVRSEPSIPSVTSLGRFFKDTDRSHITNIQFDADKDLVHNATGTYWCIHHAPLDKVRVMFPLSSPIKIGALHLHSMEQQNIYKSIYFGVAQAFGLVVDRACSDPSRLFYMPSHPRAASIYGVEVFDTGTFLDWESSPRASVSRDKNPLERLRDFEITDKEGVTFNLLSWAKQQAASFDIASVIDKHLPEVKKSDLSDGRVGYNVECPFEYSHTGDTHGTMVESGDGDHGFKFTCLHDHCRSRDRLDFIAKWIEDGKLTARIMGVGTVQQVDKIKSALAELGGTPDALPAGYEDEPEPSELPPPMQPQNLQATKEETLKQLEASKTHKMGLLCISRFKDYDIKVDESEFIDALAKSAVLFSQATKLIYDASSLRDGWSSNADELIDLLRVRRATLRPISSYMRKLIQESEVGVSLDAHKQRSAAYYDVNMKAVNDAFKSEKFTLRAESNCDENLVKKEEMFVRRWAVAEQGSDALYLDMPASLEKGRAVVKREGGLKILYKNERVMAPMGKDGDMKEVSIADWCTLKSTDLQKFTGIGFEPNRTGRTSTGGFNIWNGFRIKPKEGDPSPVLDHIRKVWCGECDDNTYNWVTMYFAHIFQHPETKPESAIALLGQPGTGKTVIFERGLERMIAPYYRKSSNPEDVVGKFNAASCFKLAFLSEEAVWSGDKAMKRRLKDRITSKETRWEEKYIPTDNVPDYCRYFFTTNDAHFFDLEAGDRRYCVLRTDDDRIGDFGYFSKLSQWLEGDGAAIWMHYLMHWNPKDYGLEWMMLKSPPLTRARLEQVELSRPASAEFFVELIREGRLTSLPNKVALETPIRLSWPLHEAIEVKQESLRKVFNQYVDYHAGSAQRFERRLFGTQFAHYVGESLEKCTKRRADESGPHTRVIVLPPRLSVLKALAKAQKPEILPEHIQWAEENPESHKTPSSE